MFVAKSDYSQYQKKVISDYYRNLDTIMLQKLSDLVGQLYLTNEKAKKERLWERVNKAMDQLNIPPAIIEHIMQQRDVVVLAKNLQDWLAVAKKK